MEERISIVTPDQIELDFELAGLGSRFLALIIDSIAIGLIVLFLFIVLAVLGIAAVFTGQTARAGSWMVAFIFFAYFILTWGYFLFFEALNAGQTPGKKWVGIRVVQDDGLPVGWRESALRNLVRIVDVLPPPACIVGGLSILLSKRGKRLGDVLAGTIVIAHDAQLEPTHRVARWGAAWIVNVESGRARGGMMLGDVRINANQLNVIERFLARRDSLSLDQRQTIAWKIASPFLAALGEDPAKLAGRPDRFQVCEQALAQILAKANSTVKKSTPIIHEDTADAKRRFWREFNHRIERFQKAGRTSLYGLAPDELTALLDDYRDLAWDLARARSMGRQSAIVRHLNSIAVRAHAVLYRKILRPTPETKVAIVGRFPLAVRRHRLAVLLSALLLFGPAVISFFAVQIHPEIAYDVIPPQFLDFQPARPESLHNIPSLARPMMASTIMTNNVQVTLMAFAFGLTAGVGTALVLISNGVQIGAIAGWMSAKGNASALWGWIMPHGGTELLAIVLAGAAGLVLAGAIVSPGEVRRPVALRRAARSVLTIQIGVMVMLVVAGLIEGFVSPSTIGFPARISILLLSLTCWAFYFGFVGRRDPPPEDGKNRFHQ